MTYPIFDPKLITQKIQSQNNIHDDNIENILKKPNYFLRDLKDNLISVNNLLNIINKEPKIKDLSHQGLSFYHYLALSNNYDLISNAFKKILSQGIPTIPLTESFVSNSNYKTNQSFFDFIFDQDCLNSYKAFYPFFNQPANHVVHNVVNSSIHVRKNWIKFYEEVYGSEEIEKTMTNYFISSENKFYFIYFLNKNNFNYPLIKKLGINLFRDDGKGSILSTFFTDTQFLESFYYNKNPLEKKISTTLGNHSYDNTLFLEKIITDKNYNPFIKSANSDIVLGESIMKFVERYFSDNLFLNDFNQKLMIEGSIQNSTKQNKKLKF